jgi:hypothetical protein
LSVFFSAWPAQVRRALVQTPILSTMWNDKGQRIQRSANLQIRIEAQFAPEPRADHLRQHHHVQGIKETEAKSGERITISGGGSGSQPTVKDTSTCMHRR